MSAYPCKSGHRSGVVVEFGCSRGRTFGLVVEAITRYIETVMIFNHWTVRKQPVLGLFTPVQEIDIVLGMVASDSAAR